MIEILPGIYYDPSKEWYEQDPQLIELALYIQQNQQPIDSNVETWQENPEHTRILSATWQGTTECGIFDMQINMHYLYSIESRAFLSKKDQDTVLVSKIA